MLPDLIKELEIIPNQKELCEALSKFITEFKEKNMRGYVYVIYVGDGLYKIGKTADLERRFNELREERLVRLINADNITKLESKIQKRFSNKRQTHSQELFRLNDQDILYIHNFPDEWKDESKIF